VRVSGERTWEGDVSRVVTSALAGKSPDEIALEIGLSTLVVRGMLEMALADLNAYVRRIGGRPIESNVPNRSSSAAEVMEAGNYFDVSAVLPDPGPPALLVTFSDLVAHDFSDLIDQNVAALRDQPNVTQVERLDREVVEVTGNVDRDALIGWLGMWWYSRLYEFL
jgi:hypothetical protein